MLIKTLALVAALLAAYTLRIAVRDDDLTETIESAAWLICAVLLMMR